MLNCCSMLVEHVKYSNHIQVYLVRGWDFWEESLFSKPNVKFFVISNNPRRQSSTVMVLEGGMRPRSGSFVSQHEFHSESLGAFTVQVLIPFLICGFGNLGAGQLLDMIQHWPVFLRITELYVLVPSLMGLKGNLEMTMAARLSTAVRFSHLSGSLLWDNHINSRFAGQLWNSGQMVRDSDNDQGESCIDTMSSNCRRLPRLNDGHCCGYNQEWKFEPNECFLAMQ